jgi:hypothetical protein
VLAEPVEHRVVSLGRCVSVVPLAGVVEEGVVDPVEDAQLVREPGRGQGLPRPNRRKASRRVSRPLAQSSATSSTM